MSYENNSYRNYPPPKTYEEKLEAWPERVRKRGVLNMELFAIDSEIAIDVLVREAELERKSKNL